LQKSCFSIEFKSVDSSIEIEAQSKPFSSIAIPITQNAKHFWFANNMLTTNSFTGQFTCSVSELAGQLGGKIKGDFLSFEARKGDPE